MKKLLLICLILVFFHSPAFSQLDKIADFNTINLPDMADSIKPFFGNPGVRSVWVADDLDQDGKPEILVTDYTNKGRVHVLELDGDVLELVWSSPVNPIGGGSTPRWVRTGDLDGDGLGEIIFPNAESTALFGDIRVRVFEWDGVNDNSYIHAIDLDANAFAGQGVGDFRMSREVAEVYDFDGDGIDEFIMSNRDNRVYILGISGDVPGFGGWQIEGGDPQMHVGAGSHWHSIAADMNGDGNIEIINHMWNYAGFWSINPTGPDTYVYPDTAQPNEYVEFLRSQSIDAVAYMGIQRVDVDGDGKDEIAMIQYTGSSDRDYDVILVSKESSDDPLYDWDTTKYAYIGENLFEVGGNTVGAFWGIGAMDIDGDGQEEILLGGAGNYHVVALKYNGSGDIMDAANYTASIIYEGPDVTTWESITINDSLGVIDTVYTESPFISKMFTGSDINNNGNPEIIVSYQSVYDTTRYIYRSWDGSAFVQDSLIRVSNPHRINVVVLEATLTGIKPLDISLVTPDDYKLEQNYPNPFNPTTSIRFALPMNKEISIKIYDILGNEVKTLIDKQEFEKGGYEVTWDGTNNLGKSVASGQYIYTLNYGNFTKSMKMTLLK
jgi:hypothetical protein